ncbi:MAG: SRPBCC domain-containing protein [Bacteroidetes bacterium]|nr:SRPBCC domain-containing protein [Bacteroidota bacterium]
MNSNEKELLITHVFDAPLEMVFYAWTDPELLKHWYAPDGCTIAFKTIEVKEGGHFHSCIYDPIHGDCWIKGTYLEIIPFEKLVFSMVLSDENGSISSSAEAGKPAEWPAEIITTVTFQAVNNQTRTTIHQTVPEEEAKKTGAYQSWIKMFNRLNRMLHPQIE